MFSTSNKNYRKFTCGSTRRKIRHCADKLKEIKSDLSHQIHSSSTGESFSKRHSIGKFCHGVKSKFTEASYQSELTPQTQTTPFSNSFKSFIPKESEFFSSSAWTSENIHSSDSPLFPTLETVESKSNVLEEKKLESVLPFPMQKSKLSKALPISKKDILDSKVLPISKEVYLKSKKLTISKEIKLEPVPSAKVEANSNTSSTSKNIVSPTNKVSTSQQKTLDMEVVPILKLEESKPILLLSTKDLPPSPISPTLENLKSNTLELKSSSVTGKESPLSLISPVMESSTVLQEQSTILEETKVESKVSSISKEQNSNLEVSKVLDDKKLDSKISSVPEQIDCSISKEEEKCFDLKESSNLESKSNVKASSVCDKSKSVKETSFISTSYVMKKNKSISKEAFNLKNELCLRRRNDPSSSYPKIPSIPKKPKLKRRKSKAASSPLSKQAEPLLLVSNASKEVSLTLEESKSEPTSFLEVNSVPGNKNPELINKNPISFLGTTSDLVSSVSNEISSFSPKSPIVSSVSSDGSLSKSSFLNECNSNPEIIKVSNNGIPNLSNPFAEKGVLESPKKPTLERNKHEFATSLDYKNYTLGLENKPDLAFSSIPNKHMPIYNNDVPNFDHVKENFNSHARDFSNSPILEKINLAYEFQSVSDNKPSNFQWKPMLQQIVDGQIDVSRPPDYIALLRQFPDTESNQRYVSLSRRIPNRLRNALESALNKMHIPTSPDYLYDFSINDASFLYTYNREPSSSPLYLRYKSGYSSYGSSFYYPHVETY